MTTATIRKWGNGLGILIPKKVYEDVGLSIGDQVDIQANPDGAIIMRPETPKYKRHKKVTIEELFAGYKGDYVPTECDWGSPVGKEIW
ncbi:multidrug transporter MatE [Actinomycetota bacterium]|nr:multidrug transporter MatE [Actinomycetota bacterium]